MAVQPNINESLRKQQLQKQENNPFLIQHSWCIIPFYVSGVQNYSNRGFVEYDINPYDAETFKRIWTGNDSCCIVWEDSVKIINNNNNNNNEPILSFQLGKYKLGFLNQNYLNNDVQPDSSYSEFISQQITNTVTFTFTKDFPFTPYDTFKFYKIPKYSKDDVYMVQNVHKVFDLNKKEVDYYTVTFKSVNQTFSNTGKTRQQNINMSSVGQGYLNPLVMNEKEFLSIPDNDKLKKNIDYIFMSNGEYLLADKEKIKHRPAKKAIIKMFGNAMPISISFVGRPVFNNDPPEKLRALRLIFPATLEQPITPNLQRTSNSSNNWYFGEFVPKIEAWKDINQALKDKTNNVITKQNYAGTFSFNKSEIEASNPLTDRNGILIPPDTNPKDIIYENTMYQNSIYQKNLNNTWEQWQPKIPEQLQSIPYTYGVDESDNSFHRFGENKNILDLMFDNYWVYKNDTQIPLTLRETRTFGSFINAGIQSLVGSIGGLMKPKKNWLSIFGLIGIGSALLGIGIGFNASKRINPQPAQKINGFVSAPFIDLSILQFQTDDGNQSNIPMTSFMNSEVDEITSLVYNSPNSFNFQIQCELTDLFENIVEDSYHKQNPKGFLFTTTSIGQKDKFELFDGNFITKPNWKILMNGQQKLVQNKNIRGYIIEQINIDSCFAGEISIEFLDENDQVIYTGIYQSEAKWTGNIRDRWTTINTSIFNNQNVLISQPLSYPSDIIEPDLSIWTPTILISDAYMYKIYLRENNEGRPTQYPHQTNKYNVDYIVDSNFNKTKKVLFTDKNWISWNFISKYYSHILITFNQNGNDITVSCPIRYFRDYNTGGSKYTYKYSTKETITYDNPTLDGQGTVWTFNWNYSGATGTWSNMFSNNIGMFGYININNISLNINYEVNLKSFTLELIDYQIEENIIDKKACSNSHPQQCNGAQAIRFQNFGYNAFGATGIKNIQLIPK